LHDRAGADDVLYVNIGHKPLLLEIVIPARKKAFR
jgi:hypothetical protein